MSGIKGAYRQAVHYSWGLRQLPHLPAFLPEVEELSFLRGSGPADALIGWGDSKWSRLAKRKALKTGLPFIGLEDGFLRSIGLGETGVPPLSIVADDLGCYFDATRPNRLENMLETGEGLCAALLDRATSARQFFVESGLSKTNMAEIGLMPSLPSAAKRILLVDQTRDDASIRFGCVPPGGFDAMVKAARDEHPGAQIVIKTHPVVAAGLKESCFSESVLQAPDIVLCGDQVQPKVLFDMVDHVYVATSLLGFEALLHGKPVTCFGAPFYAGWGVTDDRVAVARRTASRSIDEIFAAAYLAYARYINSATGQPATAEETMQRLVWLRDRAEQFKGYHALLGFTQWKRRAVENMLHSPKGQVAFFGASELAEQAAQARGGKVIVWAGAEQGPMAEAIAKIKVPLARMEDGFVRSQGLGAAFVEASSLTLDEEGIYFNPKQPSRLERILQSEEIGPSLIQRATKLRATLVESGLSKYNLWGHDEELDPIPATGRRLLVVGQVEDDASIRLGCGTGPNDVCTNEALLQRVRASNPDAYIIYKGHPDVEAGYRAGTIDPEILTTNADLVVRHADIVACLDRVDELHTMTSLSGFEALLRGLTVYTYGLPFYAGWGLTHDALKSPRRTRQRTIEELVAATLILYPTYLHPKTAVPCEVEDVIEGLRSMRAHVPAGNGRKRKSKLRRHRLWRYLSEILHPRPKTRY